MKELQKKIGYQFQNKDLLNTALSHSSFVNECKVKQCASNERLEFLGDSVLGVITATYLYQTYPHVMEGELTKMRSALVCEGALCQCARAISLGDFLRLGRGEESGGGRERDSILADAFEALIGAIYLDGGEAPARKFVHQFVIGRAGDVNPNAIRDYKTALQEIVQKNPGENLSYRTLGTCGPDHDKKFQVEVLLNSNVIGQGEGHSKKEAEQMAAKKALALMGIEQ